VVAIVGIPIAAIWFAPRSVSKGFRGAFIDFGNCRLWPALLEIAQG
jgi:hypothetical protein